MTSNEAFQISAAGAEAGTGGGVSAEHATGAVGAGDVQVVEHLLERNYSGRGRNPDVSTGEFLEDVEGATAVLGRGGQVGPHRGEVLGAGEGAQAPGDLLLDLDHADVALGRVVVKGHAKVGGKRQVVLDAPADAAGQGAVAAADRPRRAGGGVGADQGGRHDQPALRGERVGGGQDAGVGDRLERQQGVDDLGRPAPAGGHLAAGRRGVGGGVVNHGDQLPQQVGVA